MKKQEYKETPIGKIPEEWEITSLGNEEIIEELFYGITAKAADKNTGLKILRTTDIREYSADWEMLPFCEITERRGNLSKYFLRKGELIVARAGTVGVSVLVDRDFDNVIFGSYLIKVKLKSSMDPKFVHYFFQSPLYWKHLRRAQGSTLKNINLPLLKSIKIPLPPFPEQRKIAEILSTVDQAIQRADEAIARTERLKRGLMQELLTKGIGHEEFKFSQELGYEIPKECDVVRLGNVLELLRNGLTYKQNKKGIGYPTTRIETISDGLIDPIKLGYIENLRDREIEEYRLKAGDILFSHINSIEHFAKTAIYSGTPPLLIHGMNLLLLRPMKEKIEPMFLAHYLKYENTRSKLRSWAKRAVNQVSLNQTELKRFKLFLPPLPEQRRIAKILSTVTQLSSLRRKGRESSRRSSKA